MKKTLPENVRIGFGYDIHAFAWNRKLVLGGVRIPFPFGLDGHSDADVLLHAVADAVLGAVALGDIGQHFPNTSRKWKGVSSMRLLRQVRALLNKEGYDVINVDATIILEHPKLMRYKSRMASNIARALDVARTRVSVKATTNEKLGSLGRSEGCAAMAVVLVRGI